MANELRERIEHLQERLSNLWGYLDIQGKEEELRRLTQKTEGMGFWGRREEAQETLVRLRELREWVEAWRERSGEVEDLLVFHQMAEEEEDIETFTEVERGIEKAEKAVEDLELRRMLDGEDDEKNALLTIHPGAGGTESADWAAMLMRLYLRWMERHGFENETLDLQPGEEAGIKSTTISVRGPHAYGYLKAEAGVHRLVRISPFDANSRRHTSFASVFVYPEVEEGVDIQIRDEDLRIDTYRSSGAGGQHVNKTDSAVRITHLPTGIVVQCRTERSQHRNRYNAMKILMARLFQHYKEEERKKREVIENTKKRIEWGSQIRSYVMHPYTMVKDHRTEIETSNVQAVMDGDIDLFIKAYLSQE
ncbi:MAG: peptide chain release factor 2 [Candidatus Latescibacteria bacterium]|nr:peptide chain release factor 2 [Candidatus Latescibacterota bacterium]